MVFVTVHLASNLIANCIFFVLCLCTLFADYFQFDTFTVQLNGLRHELRYEDVFITSWTSFSDFNAYACTYSNNSKVRTACSNISYFQAAGFLYEVLTFCVLVAVFLCMLSLYLRMLGKDNQLSRLKLPHMIAAPVYVVAGAGYLWVSNVDHLTRPDGTREMVEGDSGIRLLFIAAGVGILTLLHYLFLKHYRHIEDIGFSFKLFEEIQEKEDRIRDLEKDKKDYTALIQDIGDLKNFLCTPGLPKLELRTLLISDLLRSVLEYWHRNLPDDRSTVNASMAVESVDAEPLAQSRRLKLGSGFTQTQKTSDDPVRDQLEKSELENQIERLKAQIEDLNQQRIRELENFEEAERERDRQTQAVMMKNQKLRGKNQKLRAQPPPKPAENPLNEHVAMQRQEIDELTLIIEDLRKQVKTLEQEKREFESRESALKSALSSQENPDKISELLQEIEKLKLQIEEIQSRETQLLKEIFDLEDTKRKLEAEIEIIKEDLKGEIEENDKLKGNLQILMTEKRGFLEDIGNLKEKIENLEDNLRKIEAEKRFFESNLKEMTNSKGENEKMSMEEIEFWKNKSRKSDFEQLEERNKEIERLNLLILTLKNRHNEEIEREKSLLTLKIEDLRSLLMRISAENSDLKETNQEKEDKIEEMERKLEDLNAQREDLDQKNLRLRKELDAINPAFAEKTHQIREISLLSSEEIAIWRNLYLQNRQKLLESQKEVMRLNMQLVILKEKYVLEKESEGNKWQMRLEDARMRGNLREKQTLELSQENKEKNRQILLLEQRISCLLLYINDLEGHLSAKNTLCATLQTDILFKNSTIDSLNQQIYTKNQEFEQLKLANKQLGDSLTSLMWEKSDLEANLGDLKREKWEISTMAQAEIDQKPNLYKEISPNPSENTTKTEILRLKSALEIEKRLNETQKRQITDLYRLIESLETSLMQTNENYTRYNEENLRKFREISDKFRKTVAEKDDFARKLVEEREKNKERNAEMMEDVSGQVSKLLEKSKIDLEKAENRAKLAENDKKDLQNALLRQEKAAKEALVDLESVWRNRFGLRNEDCNVVIVNLSGENEELTKKNKTQQTEIAALEDEKEGLVTEVQTLTGDLEEVRGELSELSVSYDTCQARVLELQHGCTKLAGTVQELDEQKNGYRKLIERLKEQLQLTKQVHEGQLSQIAKEQDGEREEIIEEFEREKQGLMEELERLRELLAQVTVEKEQQDSTVIWLGEERTRLETIALQLQAEVTQHMAKQTTMIDWLGAVWEDKLAMERLKDELVDRYTKEIDSYQHQLRKLREDFDCYKKEQESWNKTLLNAGEDKTLQSLQRIKELEALLEQEKLRSEQLQSRLHDTNQQVIDLTSQLQQLQAERDKLQADLDALRDLDTIIASLKAELDQKVHEILSLERLKEENQVKINALNDALEKLKKELELQKIHTAEIEANLKVSNEKVLVLSSEVEILKDENGAISEKNKELNTQVEELEQNLLRLKLENQRLDQTLLRSEREITALKPYLQRAKAAEGELMTLKHQLTLKNEEIEALRGDISALTDRNQTLDMENTQFRADLLALNREKTNLMAEIAKLQRNQEENERKIAELQRKNDENERKITEMQRKNDENERKIAELQRQNEENERTIAELEEIERNQEREIEELKEKIRELEAEINAKRGDDSNALRNALKEALLERDKLKIALKKAKDDLQSSQKDLQDSRNELEKSHLLLVQAETDLKQRDDLINTLQTQLADKDAIIADLNSKLNRYKKELARRKRAALLRIMLKDWNKTLVLREQKAVDRWKGKGKKAKPPVIQIGLADAPENERFPLLRLQSLEGELTDPQLRAGEALVQEEKNDLLRDNLIISAFRAAGLKEAPLAYVNVFRFFEELMDKKYEVDQADLAAFRRPRGMTEFMMEHLSRNFGLKSLAVKYLCQLLPALQTLFRQNHPYGTLFARLLQVFHRDPISFKLALFLTRIRKTYNQLVEKTDKEKVVHHSGRGISRKKANLTSQQLFEIAASGGDAYLADAIYLVYDIFEHCQDYGQLMLKLIKPAAIDVNDFIIFKICHKMAKLGLTPESLYDLIDTKKEQNLLREEFIQGVQQTMDLWVDRADLQSLFSLIDRNTSETMSKEEFVLKINFDSYYFNAKNEYYVVSKSTFLNALTDVYSTMYQHQAARLHMVYSEVGAKEMSHTKFRQVVLSIDPHFDISKVDQMFIEASQKYSDSTSVGQDGFCRILLQHGVGALRIFETQNLEEAIVERRSIAGGLDISLTSEGELVSVSSRRRSPVD